MITDQQYLERLQLSVSLRRNGYYEQALQIASDLRTARPEEYAVWHSLGQIWTETGEFENALACHQEAMRLLNVAGPLDPSRMEQFQTVALGLAQARMRFGEFNTHTWHGWEAGRLKISWSPLPGAKYYTGEEQGVDSLLVQSEGGYGDTFMFMRWLPLLKRVKGVKRLGLMVWPPLVKFCDWRMRGVDQVYEIGVDTIDYTSWEYATSIMSMPAVFDVKRYADIPEVDFPMKHVPYSPRGVQRVGFCWRAEENSSPVRTKSLPLDVAQAVVDRLPGKVFTLSPQKMDLYSAGEFEEPLRMGVEPSRMQGWFKTAEYICSMDFVVTVDTAVAHLAGLLGVPTLVLLPRSSCWRWGTHDRKSGPWYGEQLTYYRQPQALQWDAREIVKAVMERIDAPQA